ncbi:MAG TPA: prepilin-type N-terminal cleavage/methylation domain-containing protein [Agitococcus sp.]|nr:prepilin-type N-terminal cleavage/methylation domain-containing protein [Agitococcus sp.]
MKKHSMLGFTLIELMISLTLGLVIMLAAMQLLLTNQMSFNLQSGMGNVQENGRFALDYINSTVRSAEYSENIANPTIGIITEISELPGITSAALVTRNDLTALGKGSSDQLVTRMWVSQTMIDAGFRDCEGNAVASPRFVVTRYFVRADSAASPTAALSPSPAKDCLYFSDAALNSSAVFLSTCPSFSINAMVDSSLVVSVSKVITMFSAAIPSLALWLSLLSFGTPQRG